MSQHIDLIDRLNRIRDAVLLGQMALHSDTWEPPEINALSGHLWKVVNDLEALRDQFSDALGIRPDAGIAPDGAAAEADEPAAQA